LERSAALWARSSIGGMGIAVLGPIEVDGQKEGSRRATE
jgi:hypothetical protein